MTQLALFAEKREGPLKRPPAPIAISHPQNVCKENTTPMPRRKTRRIKPQRVANKYGTTIIPLHVTLGGLCKPCAERGKSVAAVKVDCILCRECWEKRYPGQLAKWGI